MKVKQANLEEQSDQQGQLNHERSETQIAEIKKVPKFMAFNQHIVYGYRMHFKDPFQILKSLFIMHNQTINIWTHLIGAIIVFAFIISFFIIVDKAQIQYQLKKYQSNLNNRFNDLDNVLEKIQVTLKNFQRSQQNQNILQNYAQFQYELRSQYKLITDSVKQQIYQINRILSYKVTLTKEQMDLRQVITQKLSQFLTIQSIFESQIYKILWHDYQSSIFSKIPTIEVTRNNIQQLQNEIKTKVIEYLQLQKQTPNPNGIPRWPIVIFLFTATVCLGSSATFHLFYPMSSSTPFIILEAFKYFRRLDYAGVLFNIVGTGIPPIYYALYCKPYIAAFYLTTMIALGTILFVTLLGNWIHKQQNKKYKPRMFGIFGLTYLIPYSHFMISELFFGNFGDAFKFSHSNFWWFSSSFSYLLGLYIYAKKWPQSKYRQKFDFIGSSHQIWHLLCLCGVAATYIAININYQTRKQCQCPI